MLFQGAHGYQESHEIRVLRLDEQMASTFADHSVHQMCIKYVRLCVSHEPGQAQQ
jgi:hypothetical protein